MVAGVERPRGKIKEEEEKFQGGGSAKEEGSTCVAAAAWVSVLDALSLSSRELSVRGEEGESRAGEQAGSLGFSSAVLFDQRNVSDGREFRFQIGWRGAFFSQRVS
jgi:hypothetical protein